MTCLLVFPRQDNKTSLPKGTLAFGDGVLFITCEPFIV